MWLVFFSFRGCSSMPFGGHRPLRKAMTKLDSVLKSRDITLSTRVHLVKAMGFFFVCFVFLVFFFNFTILYWFCHISTWIRHRYTCVPHSEPSSLPVPSLWVVPVHQPQAGYSFHIWYYTCFNTILPNHPTLSLSHRVQKTVLYISVSFAVSYTGLLLPSF